MKKKNLFTKLNEIIKSHAKSAFSLVELMISLIAISLITAAMAPVITKKLSAGTITVGSFGGEGGGGESSTDCEGLFNADCKLCNINFCLECDKTCETGFYKNIPDCVCKPCSDYGVGCEECNSKRCTTCKANYKLTDEGKCNISVVTKEYTTAGIYTFVVPDGVEELEVTLISGGAGGGGGAAVTKTDTFVIDGSGNSDNNTNNLLHTSANGLFNWTIPLSVRGKSVYISACGGGGASPGTAGNCAYGGGGGTWNKSRYLSCGASGEWGAGGAWHLGSGLGGYDPVFNEHGIGGGSGGSGGYSGGSAGKGSKVGGGGGAAENGGFGGGGGGASNGKSGACYGGGGGGGGIGGGNGASSSCHSGTQSSPGSNGAGDAENIFGAYYCAGGAAKTKGKNGAMRITYYDKPNGGTGGGSGQIVPNQIIAVTPGETLTVTVGAGGGGGTLNSSGEGANENIVTKITNSSGVVLITTAANITTVGTTGGNSDGTTAGQKGYITNGKNTAQIVSDVYINTDGEVASGQTGGAGGKMIINGVELHCSPGGGGSLDNNGADAVGYGGCGGGGGGAGAIGGAGACGYVMIKYGQ